MTDSAGHTEKMVDPYGPGDVMGRAMSTDAHEELFRLLGDVAEECPLPVLADVTLMLATVQARRLHDELFEFSVRDQDLT